MKEVILEHQSPSFIGSWFIDSSVCDGIIDFFKETNYFPIQKGISSLTMDEDKDIKESFDKSVSPFTHDLRICSYLNELQKVLELYTQRYEWCLKTSCNWMIYQHINIQWYPHNGGFKKFHFERDGELRSVTRLLVFMTYLNDVDDAGETEFYYQQLKVKPKKGLTLIWPADWTHVHRGIPSPTQEKMIITGWYNFA